MVFCALHSCRPSIIVVGLKESRPAGLWGACTWRYSSVDMFVEVVSDLLTGSMCELCAHTAQYMGACDLFFFYYWYAHHV